MFEDALLQFSSAQAVTAAAASTNIIDLAAIRDIGSGENLYVVVVCTTAMTDTGSNSTLQVDIQTDDNSSFSSNASVQTVGIFPATSAAGAKFYARIQPLAMNERYARLYFTPANGDLSAGAFTAFITHDIQNVAYYASGFSITN